MKLSSIKFKPVTLVLVAVIFGVVSFAAFWLVGNKQQGFSATSATCPVSVCVALKTDAATPDTISVKLGDVVQFNSSDGKSHSLSTGLGGDEHEHTGPYSSGEFKADEGWRVKFKEAGTFKFHDHTNPKISILVVAYQEGGDHTIKP